jgi:hypothetical protein
MDLVLPYRRMDLMRVEISDDLNAKLSTIKDLESINGKGQTETIAFLVRHYEQTENIEAFIEKKLNKIDEIIAKGIGNAFKQFFANLLKGC